MKVQGEVTKVTVVVIVVGFRFGVLSSTREVISLFDMEEASLVILFPDYRIKITYLNF